MPEEHNRRIIDHISEHLFATNEKGRSNLERESVQGKIYVVGNTVVDASLQHLDLAMKRSDSLQRFGLRSRQYALFTAHREENVDSPETLKSLVEGVSMAGDDQGLPVLFLAHPRTLKRLHQFDLFDWAQSHHSLIISEAVGYLDFLSLLANSALVFTDSGGVQQEACIHKVPTVTLRENTEWTETVEMGANRLAGTQPDRIRAACKERGNLVKDGKPFGDGQASVRIANVTREILEK